MQAKRNYQKLKTIEDYNTLDTPIPVTGITIRQPNPPTQKDQMILRMLVKPKYGTWYLPHTISWLHDIIFQLAEHDEEYTGIKDSWCYVTVRHGPIASKTDDEWHFDGSSFRIDIIPERNYVWVNHTPTQYKTGNLMFPDDFSPNKHNLFNFAATQLQNNEIKTTNSKQWYLLNPFCLHRRPPSIPEESRTFIRICFTDIEGRDINNTPNPLLQTNAYGRDPVQSFRNKLEIYDSI